MAPGRAQEIFQKFENFVGDFVRLKGSPQQGQWEAAFLQPSRDGDSMSYQAFKLMTQFWGVAMTSFRSAREASVPRTPGVRAGGYVRNVAKMGAYALAWGIPMVMMKNFLRGQELLPDWSSEKAKSDFLLSALIQSGVMGLMGDYLLGEDPSNKMGMLRRITGPVISGPGTDAALGVTALLGMAPKAIVMEDLGEQAEVAYKNFQQGVLGAYAPLWAGTGVPAQHSAFGRVGGVERRQGAEGGGEEEDG